MFCSLTSLIRRTVFVALLTASASLAVAGGPGSPRPMRDNEPSLPRLEQLLNEAGLRYTKDDQGHCYVTVEIDGEASVITLYEHEMGWTDGNEQPVKVIFAYRRVVAFPENFQFTPAFIQKIFELNNNKYFGNLTIADGGVFVTASMWLSSATAEDVWTVCCLLHNDGEHNQKDLRPYLEAAAEEE